MDMQSAVFADIVQELKAHGFDSEDGPIMKLGEEVGEFMGAYCRYRGYARRSGTLDDVRMELADVIITALCAAVYLDIDIDQAISQKLTVILSRGWRA